jgi:hypothetical protein
MDKSCAMCGKTNYLYELKFNPEETDAGIGFSKYVCGNCWETIAAIANRALASKVDQLQRDLDLLSTYVFRPKE